MMCFVACCTANLGSNNARDVFNADLIYCIFARQDCDWAALMREFRRTNYAVPDLERGEQIYRVLYEQKAAAVAHRRGLRRHEIGTATPGKQAILLIQHDLVRPRHPPRSTAWLTIVRVRNITQALFIKGTA